MRNLIHTARVYGEVKRRKLGHTVIHAASKALLQAALALKAQRAQRPAVNAEQRRGSSGNAYE